MIFEILFEQNKKKVRTKDKKSDKLIKYHFKYIILNFYLKFQIFKILFEQKFQKFSSVKNFLYQSLKTILNDKFSNIR